MTNFLSAKNIHQGTELEEGRNFVAMICDIDDIKQRVKDNGDTLTPKQVQEVYDLARRKISDLLMEDFWFSLDAFIDEVKQNENKND